MSNPVSFINSYVQNIQTLIYTLEDLRTQNDQITQDSTLISRYFSTTSYNTSANGQPITVPRTDVVAQDLTNAQAALIQLLFTFDSGSPTQKSYLFKILP